jgi:hypothetical protein
MTITADIQAAIGKIPADAWTPAYDGDGQVRDGAWFADITGKSFRMSKSDLQARPITTASATPSRRT